MAKAPPMMGLQVRVLPAGAISGEQKPMNDHEKAARYADLHEERQQLLGEIAEAQAELDRVEEAMEDLFWEMGAVGKDRIFKLLEAK
ncbi:MAG: hypothetical protein RBQ96_06575 [Candidatus Methanomethylophilaceae archaeon]|nr:hypothetical protein [Candidatus Methanomethylophilaceae archaeon]